MLENKQSGNDRPDGEICDRVLRVAAATACGLRSAMARQGIRQMTEFVNGMVLAGVLIEKCYERGSGSQRAERFVDVFEATASTARQRLLDDAFAADLAAIREHRIGLTDQTPEEMLTTAGLSAQVTVTQIAREEGFDKNEALQIVSIGIVAALLAQGKLGALQVEALIAEVMSKAGIVEDVVVALLDQLGPEGAFGI